MQPNIFAAFPPWLKCRPTRSIWNSFWLRFLAGDPAAHEALIEQANARVRRRASHAARFSRRGTLGADRRRAQPGPGPTASQLGKRAARFSAAFSQSGRGASRGACSLTWHRKYCRAARTGANHESRGGQSASGGTARFVDTTEPGDYAEWAEFHECVESLPEAEREFSACSGTTDSARPRPPTCSTSRSAASSAAGNRHADSVVSALQGESLAG